MCLFAKRLERGKFIWPSPADGVVTISAGQLGYMLARDRLEDAAAGLAAGARRIVLQ